MKSLSVDRTFELEPLIILSKNCVPEDFELMRSFEPQPDISNNVVCATSKASDQPAHTRILIRAFASRLNIL